VGKWFAENEEVQLAVSFSHPVQNKVDVVGCAGARFEQSWCKKSCKKKKNLNGRRRFTFLENVDGTQVGVANGHGLVSYRTKSTRN
jgi:hypothetical protein